MCTIALMIDVVPDAPLVVAANRDEIYARPTRPPEILRDRIIGGRDVLSGGTWLAVRGDARFAAVTNQRVLATPPPGLVSRGLAVIETVAAADPDAYVAALDPAKYASMNLVFNGPDGVKVAYTRREVGTIDVVALGSGIHVLCNDVIGAAGFPRGDRLRAALAQLAGRPIGEVLAALPALLGDNTKSALADTPDDPRFPRELANALTATCIHSEHYASEPQGEQVPLGYGTRSSTILALAPDRVVAYLHADGPPCVTPFRDMQSLL
jgi:uncharacterized protein with NRDE domain